MLAAILSASLGFSTLSTCEDMHGPRFQEYVATLDPPAGTSHEVFEGYIQSCAEVQASGGCMLPMYAEHARTLCPKTCGLCHGAMPTLFPVTTESAEARSSGFAEECGDSLAASSCDSRKAACESGSDSAQCNRCVYIIHCEGKSSYTGTCYGGGLACGYFWGNQVATYCFPSDATVQRLEQRDGLEGREAAVTTAEMADLKIGDWVMTATGFSEVYAFMDSSTAVTTEYVKLRTEVGEELRLTKQHIVFAHESRIPVMAAEVAAGDLVWVHDLQASPLSVPLAADGVTALALAPSKVLQISRVYEKGAHAPLTREGSLLVDGVLASSFAGVQTLRWGDYPLLSGHKAVALVHAPLRFVCGLMPSACGPDYHSADLGRHAYTQWVITHLGWLRALNLEHHDLKAALSTASPTAWAAAFFQALAAVVMVLLDAAIFSLSPSDLLWIAALSALLWGRHKRGQKAKRE